MQHFPRLSPAASAKKVKAWQLTFYHAVASEATAVSEAELLAKTALDHATTLLVVGGSGCGVSDFAAACNAAAGSMSALEMDVLAFHPDRVDTGPGCHSDPDDAAHYSVRSPHPTLQLLRKESVRRARAEWNRARDSKLPGALELLHFLLQRFAPLRRLLVRQLGDVLGR